MSGIELAGLFIGAASLLDLVVKRSINLAQFCTKYKNFDKEFQTRLDHLKSEKERFTCELRPFLSGSYVSDELVQSLCEDLSSDKWQSAHIKELLSRRLGDSYKTFEETKERISGYLKLLEVRLASKDGKFDYQPTATLCNVKLDFRCQRLRILHSKNIPELFEKLQQDVTKICEQIGTETIRPVEQTEDNKVIDGIRKSIEKAWSLHVATESSWKCKCPATHRVYLRLEHITSWEGDVPLKMGLEVCFSEREDSYKREVIASTSPPNFGATPLHGQIHFAPTWRSSQNGDNGITFQAYTSTHCSEIKNLCYYVRDRSWMDQSLAIFQVMTTVII
ncbi:hypothetical protein PVAG01_02842 [Phlyctema vagabunda]|uniref:Uncharacterized protein n=1 Tax=Phlyctema vagabunda TaxID=108571 RepID=A0ABR4PT27_9HELO